MGRRPRSARSPRWPFGSRGRPLSWAGASRGRGDRHPQRSPSSSSTRCRAASSSSARSVVKARCVSRQRAPWRTRIGSVSSVARTFVIWREYPFRPGLELLRVGLRQYEWRRAAKTPWCIARSQRPPRRPRASFRRTRLTSSALARAPAACRTSRASLGGESIKLGLRRTFRSFEPRSKTRSRASRSSARSKICDRRSVASFGLLGPRLFQQRPAASPRAQLGDPEGGARRAHGILAIENTAATKVHFGPLLEDSLDDAYCRAELRRRAVFRVATRANEEAIGLRSVKRRPPLLWPRLTLSPRRRRVGRLRRTTRASAICASSSAGSSRVSRTCRRAWTCRGAASDSLGKRPFLGERSQRVGELLSVDTGRLVVLFDTWAALQDELAHDAMTLTRHLDESPPSVGWVSELTRSRELSAAASNPLRDRRHCPCRRSVH